MKNYYLFINFFLLFAVLGTVAIAQTSIPDTAHAVSFFKSGSRFIAGNEPDSALVHLSKAAEIFKSKNLWQDYAKCINSIASAFRQKGNIDSSIILLENNLKLVNELPGKDILLLAKTKNQLSSSYRRKGDLVNALKLALESREALIETDDLSEKAETDYLLGMIYGDRGEFDVSLKNLSLALNNIEQLKNTGNTDSILGSRVGNIYNSMAKSYEQKGDYDNAIKFYGLALSAISESLAESHPDVASVYNNLAAAYFYQKDNHTALEFYFKALAIDLKTRKPDDLGFGTRYNNIAMAYRVNKEYEESLNYSELAKNIFINKLGDKHPNVAGVINNTGRTYSDLEQYDKAIESYKSALSIWEEKFGEDHHLAAQGYFNLGEAYRNNGDYKTAIALLSKSLSVRLKVFGERHPKTSESFEGLAKIFYLKQDYDSSLYFCQRAIISLCEEFYESNPRINPEPHKIIWANEILNPLVLKGDIFAALYLTSNDVNDLITALSGFQLATQLIDNVRHSFRAEGSKLSFGGKAAAIYEKGIKTALKLFDLTKNNSYKPAAFIFSEESKASLLFDAVSEAKAKKFSGIPDSLLEKERNTRIDLAYLDTQILNEKQKKQYSAEKISALEEKYFHAHQQYITLLEGFEKNYNSYYRLKYKERDISVKAIQKKLELLSEEYSIVEYFLSDTSLYIFVLNKDSLDKVTVRSGKNIPELIKNFRLSLQNLEFEKYIISASSLFKILIEPVEQHISKAKHLYIIPDGILNYLPYDALLTREVKIEDNINFSKLPYMINKFTISYLFSADFLLEENVKQHSQKSFAGFAPVFSSAAGNVPTPLLPKRGVEVNSKRYSELPESKAEVENISSLFQKRNLTAAGFISGNAKEKTIKSGEITNYTFLHIASHCFINEESPEYSGIIFTDKDNSPGEDGILYSNEIYNLNLNSDLVVLSACESGLGRIVRGEGIIGLTRGFIYSGVKNIVVSLWQVADKSTSELMVEFYKNILNEKNYSSALREAKLKLISEGEYSYPLEWSPFVLIGK